MFYFIQERSDVCVKCQDSGGKYSQLACQTHSGRGVTGVIIRPLYVPKRSDVPAVSRYLHVELCDSRCTIEDGLNAIPCSVPFGFHWLSWLDTLYPNAIVIKTMPLRPNLGLFKLSSALNQRYHKLRTLENDLVGVF